jgi:hypothetical protein
MPVRFHPEADAEMTAAAMFYKPKWGMMQYVGLLAENGMPVPPKNPSPKIIVQNEECATGMPLPAFVI